MTPRLDRRFPPVVPRKRRRWWYPEDCFHSHLQEACNTVCLRLLSEGVPVETLVHLGVSVESAPRTLVGAGVKRPLWIQTNLQPVTPADLEPLSPLLRHFEGVVAHCADLDSCGVVDALLRNKVHAVGVGRTAGIGNLGRLLNRLGHENDAYPEQPHCPRAEAPDLLPCMLREQGLQVRGACAKGGDADRTASFFGEALTRGLLGVRAEWLVRAACVGDDSIANYAMRALRRAKLRIPHDLSVTGFNGMLFGAILTVPLTALRVPGAEVVDQVVDLVARHAPAARHESEPELVLRESQGAVPGHAQGRAAQ